MSYPATMYIKQLHSLRQDLDILMREWSPNINFDIAKKEAEAVLPLIQAEVENLKNMPVTSCLSSSLELRGHIESLCKLMEDESKEQFEQYIAMLDSLINEGIS